LNALIWKRRLGKIFNSKNSGKRDVILNYHSIEGGSLSLSKKNFYEQIAWLKDNAKVITLDEILNEPNHGDLRVVLSFDDGYHTLFTNVQPILSASGFPAIVYVNSGLLGEDTHLPSVQELGHYPDEFFLRWEEVSFLAQCGWIIGAHGVDHVDLTKTSANETYNQLTECKKSIESKLGIPCSHFAYTWGRYNYHVQLAVKSIGFYSAAACLHGPITKFSNRFALPRVDIRADYELHDFIDVVTGHWDYIGFKHRLERMFI